MKLGNLFCKRAPNKAQKRHHPSLRPYMRSVPLSLCGALAANCLGSWNFHKWSGAFNNIAVARWAALDFRSFAHSVPCKRAFIYHLCLMKTLEIVAFNHLYSAVLKGTQRFVTKKGKHHGHFIRSIRSSYILDRQILRTYRIPYS